MGRTMPVAEWMTADEYLRLPADGWPRTQLVDGEVVLSQPDVTHQRVRDEIHFALTLWVRAASGRGRAISPLDVRLNDFNVYAPDILWYRQSRVPDGDDPRPYPLPELAVEVRSPSTWRYDIGTKKRVYEERGLPELWLVDTAADIVLVFRRSTRQAARFDVSLELTRDDALTSPQLQGFSLSVAELFGGDAAA